MALIKSQDFGNISVGTAHVNLIRYANGSFAIGRHLPAGIDIAPSCYTADTEAEALAIFERTCKAVESFGYPRA